MRAAREDVGEEEEDESGRPGKVSLKAIRSMNLFHSNHGTLAHWFGIASFDLDLAYQNSPKN